MFLKVDLEPSGEKSDRILLDWQNAWQLENDEGILKLDNINPLDVIMDLRGRCYEHGITVNIIFHDSPDMKYFPKT